MVAKVVDARGPMTGASCGLCVGRSPLAEVVDARGPMTGAFVSAEAHLPKLVARVAFAWANDRERSALGRRWRRWPRQVCFTIETKTIRAILHYHRSDPAQHRRESRFETEMPPQGKKYYYRRQQEVGK